MHVQTTSQGRWIHRFFIRLLTIVLGVLVYWTLGFMVDDIRTIPGPKYEDIEHQHVDPALVTQRLHLEKRIAELSRTLENQREKQKIVGDSSNNLQQTMTQLLELQTLGLQKNIPFSETEQTNFTTSLNLFLDNQKKYQELSQAVAEMLEQKQDLLLEKEQIEQQLEQQREPARKEYNALNRSHKLQMAFFQLAILVPILVLAMILIIKKRTSIYAHLFWALGAATLIKVALVMHEYFPSKYFKYVFIAALLVAVTRLLMYFIRSSAFPKTEWLLKQYREAYERFLCPVCDYPIRIGPRRYLFWTRRTVNKIVVPGNPCSEQEEAYTCPSCGSNLFAECSVCHKIRHTMLPSCRHCGALKDISARV